MHISELNALEYLSYSPEWHAARKQSVGGSDAGKIASGDAETLEALRLDKLGRSKPEDLSRVLPVQMGSWTEPLNRLFLSYAIEKDVKPGKAVHNSQYPWARASLDGVTDGAIVECKHVNEFSKIDAVLEKYYAQLQHNMACASADAAYLSVIIGTAKFHHVLVARDDDYVTDLMEREESFWDHVVMDIPIHEAQPVAAEPKIPRERIVDMDRNNEWAVIAGKIIESKSAADIFKKSCDEIKKLVDSDVKRAHGHGVEVTVDGRGKTVKIIRK